MSEQSWLINDCPQCDKVRPCNACCSRGKPKDCFFPEEANSKAIDQSQEINLLRRTNQELERKNDELGQKLDRLGSSMADSDGSRNPLQSTPPGQPFRELSSSTRTMKRKSPRYDDARHNLYFGSISIAEVIHEVSHLDRFSVHADAYIFSSRS